MQWGHAFSRHPDKQSCQVRLTWCLIHIIVRKVAYFCSSNVIIWTTWFQSNNQWWACAEGSVLQRQCEDRKRCSDAAKSWTILINSEESFLICFSREKPGAVVLRVAKSWLRIGSVEILSQSKEIDLLRCVFRVRDTSLRNSREICKVFLLPFGQPNTIPMFSTGSCWTLWLMNTSLQLVPTTQINTW